MNKNIRILLAEDSEDDAILIIHHIKKGGYLVDSLRVETEEEMRLALKNNTWDIVLSDYKMPRFDGLEALMVFKESGLDIPFIIISGTIGEDLAVEAMKAGAHDYLMKNNLQRLLPAIEREIRDSKSREKQRAVEKQIALLNFSLDSVNEAAFLCNHQGNLLYVNTEACKSLGYAREELLKMSITEVISDSISGNKWNEYAKALQTKGSLRSEILHKTKDGNFFPAEINLSSFEYESGTYILVLSRNIIERKHAEEELQRLNRELRAISNCNLTLLRAIDEQTLINEICRIICEEAGYRMAWVGYAQNDADKTVQPVAWSGYVDNYLNTTKITWGNTSTGNGPAGKAIKSGKSIYISNFNDDPEFAPWIEVANKCGYRSGFALPLKDDKDNVFGILMIYSSEVKTITSDELRLMEEMAGDLAFGIITLRNQAQRKKAEEALITSEERFSNIFKLSPIAMAIFRTSDEQIIDVNDVFVKQSGYSREEIVGHTTLDLNLYGELKERNTILKILQEKGFINDFEFKIRNKAGDIGVAINTTIEITLEGEKHYLSSILDITERKKAENELRKLSRAVEQSPVSVIITDLNGTIEYVNEKFSEVTGFSKNEAIGQNPRILKSGEMSDDNYKNLWQTITSGKEWRGELHNKRKNGELFWEQVSISPIFNSKGQTTHFLSVKEDITHRKQTEMELIQAKEKAEESDRLKTSFLCNMSHEIRTPMNAIIGFASFLQEHELPESKRHEYSKIIMDRTYDLLRIVEDILDISKIEVGQLTIIETQTNLAEMMNEIFDYHKLRLTTLKTHPEIQITLSMPDDLRYLVVETDVQRLRQILLNLLDNALKFTKEGFIDFGYKVTPHNELLFHVKDTGIGIPKNKQEIIFDRFRQAEDSMTARQYGGTGLGLSIVKGLVTLMKGKIWLESKVNEGTAFYFTLPLKLHATDKISKEEVSPTPIKSWKGKVILIVEDDEANAKYLKYALSDKGAEILIAYNGQEVLNLVKTNPNINLILMDIRLPDINGLVLTKLIRKNNPAISIIAQTAYASSKDIEECIYAGCKDYISKPINFNNLISSINRLLLGNIC
jgi:PAS domain S-box